MAEQWKSRWGLIFASMGAAVGTGNIWRFPKEVASNGGGGFLIPWLIFLFTWSIPLLIAEFAIGKKTRYGTIGAFKKFAGKKYAWMGGWMMFVSAAINFYYAVLMGWVLRYVFITSTGGVTPTTDTYQLWYDFISSPLQVIFWQAIAVVIGTYVVYRGVSKGIERVNFVLIPALYVLLIIAAIWALSRPYAFEGLKYMFIPRPESLFSAKTWISALAQSAWSTSAGMGMAITYAVYMKRKEDTSLNAFITGLGNNSVSLIAGIAIICTVFAGTYANMGAGAPASAAGTPTTVAVNALSSDPSGLAFIHLTNLFTSMPGGTVLAVLFFVAVSFAALTSLISGFEISTRNFMDHGLERKKALKIVSIGSFLMGLPSAAIVIWVSGKPEPAFFDNQDMVWGLGLIISGLFVAFAVWKYGISRFRENMVNTPYSDIYIGRWWEYVIKYLFPLQFGVLIFWYIYQTATESSAHWWKAGPGGIALLILEWSVVIYLLIRFNGWLNRQPLVPNDADDSDLDADEEDEMLAEALADGS